MYGQGNMEAYITICKIDTQWEFAVCLRELIQGLCINLEPRGPSIAYLRIMEKLWRFDPLGES